VFRGRLTFQMIRLKLALDLPRDVFTSPPWSASSPSSLRSSASTRPSTSCATAVVEHVGPQVDSLGPLGTLKGAALLHLATSTSSTSTLRSGVATGAGLDVRVTYFDGLELGANYQGRGLIFDDDLWRVGVMGGGGVRQDLQSHAYYVFPSRLYAEALWYTPAIASVRSFVWLRGEGLARQRWNLGLENYLATNSEAVGQYSGPPGWRRCVVFIGLACSTSTCSVSVGPVGALHQPRWGASCGAGAASCSSASSWCWTPAMPGGIAGTRHPSMDGCGATWSGSTRWPTAR